MLNAAFPIFDAIDSWVALVLPLWARISIWGLAAGILAMAVYKATSNQADISDLKREIRLLRKQMLDPALDSFTDYSALAKRNLTASMRLLGKTLGPALLSGLPVLLIATWLNSSHGFCLPAELGGIRTSCIPPSALKVLPETAASRTDTGLSVMPAQPPARVSFLVGGETVYAGLPFAFPKPVIAKRKWWNFMLESRSGYVDPKASVDEIHLEILRTRVFGAGPDWAAGWEFVYFLGVLLAAASVKLIFRLH